MKKYFISLCVFIAACKTDDPNFRYVKLEDFKYEKADIKEGATIEVLSFSGGKNCNGAVAYYYQFIGIDKSNGDTVRILTPCQAITDTLNLSTGTFASWDKTAAIITDAMTSQGKTSLLAGDEGIVVFNKQYSDIEDRNYKTAIGTLAFGKADK